MRITKLTILTSLELVHVLSFLEKFCLAWKIWLLNLGLERLQSSEQ